MLRPNISELLGEKICVKIERSKKNELENFVIKEKLVWKSCRYPKSIYLENKCVSSHLKVDIVTKFLV